MPSVSDVAKLFLFLASKAPECPDPMTHMKLHKLCYYAQGIHLALYDEVLFPEEIQAWEHGPVIPALYEEYKEFGLGIVVPRLEEKKQEPSLIHLVWNGNKLWKIKKQLVMTGLAYDQYIINAAQIKA